MPIDTIHVSDLNPDNFTEAFNSKGYVVVTGVLSDDLIDNLIPELEHAIEQEAGFHGTKDYKDYGMLLACPIYGGKFLDITGDRTFMAPFEWMLGDGCIMWVYTSSSMPPHKGNYATRIHVDRPHFIPGFLEAMGSLILLTDFTEENGATWIYPGSHTRQEMPDEEEFFRNAVRLEAPRGSVIYFNLRLWHAGGINRSDQWRHCLGIGMIRPYIKQRIDLPRAMKDVDISGLSDYALQKLGFFSQPPSSLEEFHAPPEKKKYRQRSEWDRTVNG